jgi:hypothetical protein
MGNVAVTALIALWVGPALILAIMMATVPARPRRFWLWCFGAAIIAHLIFVALSPDEFQLNRFLVGAGLLVVLPWVLVGALFVLSGYPNRRIVISLAMPFAWGFAYLGAWYFGIRIGLLHI